MSTQRKRDWFLNPWPTMPVEQNLARAGGDSVTQQPLQWQRRWSLFSIHGIQVPAVRCRDKHKPLWVATEVETPPVRKSFIEMSVKEPVAKAIVPVKKESMCPAPTRLATDNSPPTTAASAHVINEKKSKRRIKRERNQALLLCLIYFVEFNRIAHMRKHHTL